MTKSTGCWAAMRSRIVSRACRVCCFCCSGGHRQGGIVVAQRQGEEGGKEGHRLRQRQAILHQEPLQFAQLLRRGLLPLEAQRHPLQQIDQRIQGGVLVIGRTLARRQPRLGLGGHMLRQHLHQARFADARFAAEQHHLPRPSLTCAQRSSSSPTSCSRPTSGVRPGAAGGFQATAGHTLVEHLIDRQRLGEAFQEAGCLTTGRQRSRRAAERWLH